MLPRPLLLPAAAACLGACATFDRPSYVDPLLIRQASADAAAQVKRCYRAPRVLGEGRRIATRLQVRFGPDGSVIGLPVVVEQGGITPGNRLFAEAMAEAAIASVLRCAPLRLPPEVVEKGGSSFELTFSPALRG